MKPPPSCAPNTVAGRPSSNFPAPSSNVRLSRINRSKIMNHATRRIVTGHDDNGKAIIESDGPAPNMRVRDVAGFFSPLLWVTDETPANVVPRIDRADRTIGVAPPANGSILRIV